jgi:hypothetical protein
MQAAAIGTNTNPNIMVGILMNARNTNQVGMKYINRHMVTAFTHILKCLG